MRPLDVLRLPLDALALASGAKSFVRNPVIGSRRLNEWGLHPRRVALAERMAAARRARMAHLIPAEDRDAFSRDGFVVKTDFLPADLFAQAVAEAHAHVAAPREMRQGPAVTRRIHLDRVDADRLPACVAAAHDPRFDALMRYVSSHDVASLRQLQIVIADPDRGAVDPQTALHLDTFHANAKAWLFLQDVGPDDGPFAYVPGSHIIDAPRLAWEQEQALKACDDGKSYHARGSFRATAEDLARLGLPPPRVMTVKANTLVVADTHGFHARTPSPKPTLRMEIYATSRRNPFSPGIGLDYMALPWVRERPGRLLDAALDQAVRLGLVSNSWPRVAPRRMDSPDVG